MRRRIAPGSGAASRRSGADTLPAVSSAVPADRPGASRRAATPGTAAHRTEGERHRPDSAHDRTSGKEPNDAGNTNSVSATWLSPRTAHPLARPSSATAPRQDEAVIASYCVTRGAQRLTCDSRCADVHTPRGKVSVWNKVCHLTSHQRRISGGVIGIMCAICRCSIRFVPIIGLEYSAPSAMSALLVPDGALYSKRQTLFQTDKEILPYFGRCYASISALELAEFARIH
jgi:hypothetical protein